MRWPPRLLKSILRANIALLYFQPGKELDRVVAEDLAFVVGAQELHPLDHGNEVVRWLARVRVHDRGPTARRLGPEHHAIHAVFLDRRRQELAVVRAAVVVQVVRAQPLDHVFATRGLRAGDIDGATARLATWRAMQDPAAERSPAVADDDRQARESLEHVAVLEQQLYKALLGEVVVLVAVGDVLKPWVADDRR